MIVLVCLECSEDMEEVRTNLFHCPQCGFTAEQTTMSLLEGEHELRREDPYDVGQ